MTLLLPASPVACAVLSGRLHFLRRYGNSVKRSALSIRALHRADVIARNFERALTSRLMPFEATASESVHGDCTHCGKCCLDSACVFLEWDPGSESNSGNIKDNGNVVNSDIKNPLATSASQRGLSRCTIHNNWFWKLTSCGSYPIDSQSIAIYDCPSFKAIPIRVVRQLQAPAQPHPR